MQHRASPRHTKSRALCRTLEPGDVCVSALRQECLRQDPKPNLRRPPARRRPSLPAANSAASGSGGPAPLPKAKAKGRAQGAAPAGGERHGRMETWPPDCPSSKWRLARISGGGWGATCKLHTDVDSTLTCQKQFTVRGLSDEEMRLRLMGWLVDGTCIANGNPKARKQHVLETDLRNQPVRLEAELEAAARAFWASRPP